MKNRPDGLVGNLPRGSRRQIAGALATMGQDSTSLLVPGCC